MKTVANLDWIPKPSQLFSNIGNVGFSPKVDYIKIADETIENPAISARYDSNFQLLLGYTHHKFLPEVNYAYVRPQHSGKEVALLMVQQQTTDNGTEITFLPKTSPATLYGGGAEANKVSISILNGSDLFFYQKKLRLENEEYAFEVEQPPENREIFKNRREYKKSSFVTHNVNIMRKNGEQTDSHDFFGAAFLLANFLTLVRGGYVGIGHMIGLDDDQIKFAELGFNKFDNFVLPKGWFDIGQVQELPELFSKFSDVNKRGEDRIILRNCLEFYRASNSIRDTSIEMAIVASHASLETIVPYILKDRAGWSEELLRGRNSFHSKFRAAAAFIGLSANPLGAVDVQDSHLA